MTTKEELLELIGENVRVTVNCGRNFTMTNSGFLCRNTNKDLFEVWSLGERIAVFHSENVNLNSNLSAKSIIVSF